MGSTQREFFIGKVRKEVYPIFVALVDFCSTKKNIKLKLQATIIPKKNFHYKNCRNRQNSPIKTTKTLVIFANIKLHIIRFQPSTERKPTIFYYPINIL
jgi:hypothetical protein